MQNDQLAAKNGSKAIVMGRQASETETEAV